MKAIHLSDRGVVSIAGADAAPLLQGLVTCDVPAAATGGMAYGALLTPQGKLLFDFILHRYGDGFVADLPRAAVDEFLKRLKLYRLRAKVDLADRSDELAVVQLVGAEAGEEPAGRPDPRHSELGNRLVLAAEEAARLAGEIGAAPLEDYHAGRIALAVPEAPYDFAYGEAFPHDVAMDSLGGIAFKKGCYVGQEVVSRMQHRGSARRRIVKVTADGELPEPGTAIVAGERAVGTLGSRSGGAGIAVVRLDRARPDDKMPTCGDVAVSLTIPDWASYSWPEQPPSAAE